MLKFIIIVLIAVDISMSTLRSCKRFRTTNHVTILQKYRKTNYKHLQYVIFKCQRGYYRNGPQIRRCIDGTWIGKIPTCIKKKVTKPQTCSKVSSIRNGRVTARSNRINAKRYFFCYQRYYLVGSSSQKCLSTLKWSGKIPRCVRDVACPDPGTPKNGFRFGDSFKNSKTVQFSCKKDYKLVGSRVRRCMSNRKWNGKEARCKKIDQLEELKDVAKKLRQNVVDKFSLMTTDSRARSGIKSGVSGLDFVFVLDHSQSVGATNFKKGVKFAGKIIENFGVSDEPLGTRVAVLTFHSEVQIQYNLKTNSIKDINATLEALSNLQFIGGGTNIQLALEKVYHDVRAEARKDSKKVLFLITDGHSNTNTKPEIMAARLREKGFEIFAIGITKGANEKELRSIGSQPYRSHVYLIDSYTTLEKLVYLITNGSAVEYECGEAGDTRLRSELETPHRNKSMSDAWPWQAAVYVNEIFRCGATLIDNNWLISSSRCFNKTERKEKTNIRATLGIYNRQTIKGTEQDIKVVNLYRAKKVRGKSRDDLILLKLEYEIKLNRYVLPICLDEDPHSSFLWPTQHGVVTGWGSNKKSHIPQEDEIHQTVVKFVSLNECEKNTAYDLTGHVVCGSSFAPDQINQCIGDSGGPVMVRSQDDSWILVGVMKYNEGCFNEKYSVFTKVGQYAQWINKVISTR